MATSEDVVKFVNSKLEKLTKKIVKLNEDKLQLTQEISQFPNSDFIKKNLNKISKQLLAAEIEKSIFENINI